MAVDTTNDADRNAVTPARLRDIGLFGGMSTSTLDLLCQNVPVSPVEPGQRVVEENEPARCMYVVLEGELEVIKRGRHETDVRIAVLGRNDWFGEMSLLDVQPRSASVLCVAPSLLLSITHQHVDQLLYRNDPKSYTLLMMNIARELSRRLRVADGILTHLQLMLADDYGRGSGAR